MNALHLALRFPNLSTGPRGPVLVSTSYISLTAPTRFGLVSAVGFGAREGGFERSGGRTDGRTVRLILTLSACITLGVRDSLSFVGRGGWTDGLYSISPRSLWARAALEWSAGWLRLTGTTLAFTLPCLTLLLSLINETKSFSFFGSAVQHSDMYM